MRDNHRETHTKMVGMRKVCFASCQCFLYSGSYPQLYLTFKHCIASTQNKSATLKAKLNKSLLLKRRQMAAINCYLYNSHTVLLLCLYVYSF